MVTSHCKNSWWQAVYILVMFFLCFNVAHNIFLFSSSFHFRLYHTLIEQSHRYRRHQAACREPAGSYDKTTRTAICFEHKTQYILIRAPYTRIVVFWHINNIHPWFRRVKLVVIPLRLIQKQFLWNIAIQPVVGCYNSRANLRCSGCYPLGENLLWSRSII